MGRCETALQLSGGQRTTFQGLDHEEDGYCFPDIQEKFEQALYQKGPHARLSENAQEATSFLRCIHAVQVVGV